MSFSLTLKVRLVRFGVPSMMSSGPHHITSPRHWTFVFDLIQRVVQEALHDMHHIRLKVACNTGTKQLPAVETLVFEDKACGGNLLGGDYREMPHRFLPMSAVKLQPCGTDMAYVA